MKYFLIILAFSFSSQMFAMNEREFVKQLKNTHPFFIQQALLSKIRQIEKRTTTANEDWIIRLSGNYENENVSDISSSIYDNLETTSVEIAATRKLVESGSDITFRHTFRNQDGDINTTRNRFSIDYTHPLLRNNGGINDRLDTDIAQLAIEQNVLERLEQEENFILKRLKRFIDLAYAQEQLLINERRLTLANQELSLVKEKFSAFVVDKVDILLQEDAYQAAEQQLLQARQDLIVLRHEIAITLGIDFKQAVAELNLYDTHRLDNQYGRNQLLANSRVLKITDLDKKVSKRQLSSFRNEDLVQLDLNLGLASEGENANYSNSLENQGRSWNIGLGLSYPLGGIKSSSNINRAQIELARLEQFKQEQLLDLYAQFSTLREKINLLIQTLQSNKKQIEIAKARTIEERNRYSNGNGEASFVINAQNNEQNAQLSYAKVASDYQKSVLEYKATLDQLLP